jgi:poly(A) polymerase
MHPALERIREALLGSAFEGDVFLVGGAVRDQLLGRSGSDDLDLVTERSAPELALYLWEKGVSTIHPVIFERFGTAMIQVEDKQVELVTARSESYMSDSRKPDVEPGTYLQDARRRDFTVNTLMQSLQTGEIVDPLGLAKPDLEAKVLRTPLDPLTTFEDDPLRMLRAVRFRWKLGFTYAPGLEEAIKAKRQRLEIISAERIRDEFVKILRHPSAPDALQDLLQLGLLELFLPEFLAMVDCEQGSFHHHDAWEHTLHVVKVLHERFPDASEQTLLGGLFHDIAKPQTRAVTPEGKTTFYTHEVVGAELAHEVMMRLKFPRDEADTVRKLVKNHMRIGSADGFSDSAARKLIKDLGEDLEALLQVIEADAASLKPGVVVRSHDLNSVREAIERVRLATPVESLRSPLTGAEIMELTGLPAGPKVGELKKMLEEAVLNGELTADDRDLAIARLRDLHPSG